MDEMADSQTCVNSIRKIESAVKAASRLDSISGDRATMDVQRVGIVRKWT